MAEPDSVSPWAPPTGQKFQKVTHSRFMIHPKNPMLDGWETVRVKFVRCDSNDPAERSVDDGNGVRR